MEHRPQEWWDRYFLGLAEYVSTASRDNGTRVGAVIVDDKRRVVSIGYNGFARGVNDDPALYANRDVKLLRIVHAEVNAVLFANRSVEGCTLYTWPFQCCCRCSSIVIQAGIRRVIAPEMSVEIASRWADDVAEAKKQFDEAGVELVILPSRQAEEEMKAFNAMDW